MAEDHAKLSPSAAERWMTCPGSVVLCEKMPQPPPSPYAAEGTLAHSVAEGILTNKIMTCSPDMLAHVMTYVNAVRELNATKTVLHVEVAVKVNKAIWGTADAIVWDPKTRTLYVRDLKFGAGVGVEVQGNLQLKIYALAALLTMKYPAKIVNVGIIQPRYGHPDGPSRSVDFDAVDLMDFHADLLDATKRVDEAYMKGDGWRCAKTTEAIWNDTFLVPSEKGCRWCLAAPTCPKLKQMAKDEAKKVFAKDLPYDPFELAKTLDTLDILEGWIKNVREFAYSQAESGIPIPHYKLVDKRATRKWKTDVDSAALAKLLKVPVAELMKPQELKPLGEIEPLAPGKNKDERAAILVPFVTKESSGHTLAHESDNREAVRIDAKAVFD